MTPMKIELAEKFLKRFDYDLTTLQVFPTVINGKARWPKQSGKYLATGEPGSTAIAFKGPLHKQPFLKDLKLLQRQRMGVYFMVNEGDGELHNHKIVRNSKAVHTLKALFVDTDEGDHRKLDKFCREHKLKPHVIIESSPGKYHYYFFLETTEASKENVSLWKACQQKLASLDPNFDSSMSDLGRVLRIPGFYHTKQQPFLIEEKYANSHKRYSLDDLFKRIGCNETDVEESLKYTHPTKKLSAGARHAGLNAYIGSLTNITRDQEHIANAATGFTIRHFTDYTPWLPNGNRCSELRDQVHFYLAEREKEDLENSLTHLKTHTADGFKKLPDEFYLKAPGLVGKIVREICHYSTQPYPSFAFAAACSLIGTLKAPFIRGEFMNTPPSLYSLCLAESGRGKDFPRAVVANAFMRLSTQGLLTQKFRSAQGFLKRLSKSNGIQLVLHDEAHHLFSQIRKGDTDYITTLKPLLLELFTSANTPSYDCGSVVTTSHDIPPIPYPTLNYCGFGVPTGFESTFQSGELFEGLLTRFLIFRDHQPVLPTKGQSGKLPKKFKFEEYLKEMGSKLKLSLETAILDSKNAKTFVQIPLTIEARELLDQYSERIANYRNDTGTPKALDLLQSRLVEQVNRLSVILSESNITREIIQFSIQIVDHCYENLAVHVDSFNKGQGNRDLDDLLEFIANRMRINKGPMQAQELCFYKIRDRYALSNTLQLGIDLSKIKKIDNYRRPGVIKGPTSIAYQLIENL